MELSAQIESYIRESFYVDADDAGFGPAVDLWEEGYVDSTGMVEVITFLEDLMGGTRIPDEIMMGTRLSTINGMVEVVRELSNEQSLQQPAV